eukprot:4427415-Alexandrium_andersonii.AAC.1
MAVDSVRRLGYRGRCFSRQTPALVDLRRGVADALASARGSESPQIILQSPAAHEPQANGSVENA